MKSIKKLLSISTILCTMYLFNRLYMYQPLIDHWYHIRFCLSVSALSFLPDGRNHGVGSKAKAKALGESKVKADLEGSTGRKQKVKQLLLCSKVNNGIKGHYGVNLVCTVHYNAC